MNDTTTLPKGLKRFRLGVYHHDLNQPISLHRIMGPLGAMCREEPRLELVFPPLELPDLARGKPGGQRLSWDWLVRCDAVFMLHPESDAAAHCAGLAWQMGIPVWSEYVDDVFQVEESNPGYQFHKNKRMLRDNIGSVTKYSTIVSCVSEYNRQAILNGLAEDEPELDDDRSRKFVVVPEGCSWPQWIEPRRKCVSWRGLGSHGKDVAEVMAQLLNVARQRPDWEWVLGGDQTILEEMGRALAPICGKDKVLLMPYWPTPFDAMNAWAGQCPFLHLVPLADTPFNRSKSHLAWLEASAVGAAVIAPEHLPEWEQPGVITYYHGELAVNGKAHLEDVVLREMERFNDGLFHPAVHTAREAIYPSRTLYAMNRRRWGILRKLAEFSQLAMGAAKAAERMEA